MSSRKGPLRPIGWPPDARFRDLRRVGAGETKPSLSSAPARPTGNDTALQCISEDHGPAGSFPAVRVAQGAASAFKRLLRYFSAREGGPSR
jgi:hypothetical protein